MNTKCSACQQSAGEDQPNYCISCFIPIIQYHNGVYLEIPVAKCRNCDVDLITEICDNCDTIHDISKPPLVMSDEFESRDEKREQLSKQLMKDNRLLIQIIEMLGLTHLNDAEQAVALSSLAMEKMHFLSVEYNFTEAHTLLDLGYGLSKELDVEWALVLTKLRLSIYYIKNGALGQAISWLHSLIQENGTTEHAKLRQLEIKAHLALSYAFIGFSAISSQLFETIHGELKQLFERMETRIHNIASSEDRKAHLLGPNEDMKLAGDFPRVDMIATVLVILVECELVLGSSNNQQISDNVLDRMLELQNMVYILSDITPTDDPVYYASYIRDFVRLFNGLFWYGKFTLSNNATKRRLLIERGFELIMRWFKLLPVEYWLPLRPARFLEIFIRAELWNDLIQGTKLGLDMLEKSSKYHKAHFHYVIADTYVRLNKMEEATNHLLTIVQMDREFVDDTLITISQRLLTQIELELQGILTGVQYISTWEYPIIVEMKGTEFLFQMSDMIREGVAIFGDIFQEKYGDLIPELTRVNHITETDYEWGMQHPMSLMVMDISTNEYQNTFLFEQFGVDQLEDGDILGSTNLYVLIGVNKEISSLGSLLRILSELIAEDIYSVQIYGIKL
ncbi:MAG: hypothetical protein OEY49_11670 [Candidatus Heimdallarchaeota archaeon]|nr:hypothetical protein [Candidatus Heimdallarchaeota archaeon]